MEPVLKDTVSANFVVIPPTPRDLTGFAPGIIMLLTQGLDSSDLGLGSKWTVEEINNGDITFHALGTPSVRNRRTCPRSDVNTHFTPRRLKC
jgi:hypothetical protein